MLTLAICPHEAEEDRQKWELYAEKLSSLLREEVIVKRFKNFEEEEKRLQETLPHIYYARPKIALELKHLGYVPVAKLRGKRERFVIIKKKGRTLGEPISVSTIDSPYMLVALVNYLRSLNELNIIHEGDFRKILEDVAEGRTDLGVVHGDFWEAVKQNYEDKLEVEKEIFYPNLHVLMAKEEVADRVGAAVELIPDFAKAGEEDLAFIEDFEKVGRYFLVFRSTHDISQAILNAPYIGVLIYRDKILYANKAVSQITGYTEKELKGMSPLELVDDSEDKELLRELMERRMRGEQFTRVYAELKLKRKDGKTIYTLIFSRTILFEGKYAGFVVVLDITARRRIEQLYDLMKDINQLIIKTVSEKELFRNVCNLLVNRLDLPLVWVGVRVNSDIRPYQACGREKEYVKHLRIPIADKGEETHPVALAYLKREIVITNDVRKLPDTAKWREGMLKRGLLSLCSIPLIRGEKVIAVINLYANEPDFFTEKMKEVLEELRDDLSFSLDRLVEIRRLAVINKALELAEEWVVVFDEKGRIRFTNEAIRELFGYKPQEIMGKSLDFFKSPYINSKKLEMLFDKLRRGERVTTTLPLRRKSGGYVYLNAKFIPVKLPNEREVFVMVGKDITLELELTEEVEKAKFFDLLTDLYNFNGFSFKIQEILADYEGLAALILIDIHHLSYINHHYGLYIGDEILKEVAKRLKKHFRSYDIIAKLGGDEFGIFTWKIKNKEEITFLERKLSKIFEETVKVGSVEIPIKINAGIAIYPDDGRDFKSLYEKATVALKRAKDEGPGEIKFFNEEMEAISEKHVKVDILIEKAVRNNWFVFFYQPYFSLKDGRLAGFEALVRIVDDEGKLHTPGEFIEFLEKSPYLRDFQYWALEEITRKARKWSVPIALNLYPKSLGDREFMQAVVEKCLREDVRITLEITERAVVENVESVKETFGFLKEACSGIYIAVDDFGTGYSAFAYLKELPLDYLKIDISFIRDLTKGEKDRALVNAMVQMAHSLGLKTIAEGVETQEQLEILKEIGCDMAQGYYFSKPIPAEEVERRLRDWINAKFRGEE
ncbi:EAL domain-containing protein [Aquifex sp.]